MVEAIRHAAGHVPGVADVVDVRARWLGHELHADVAIAVDTALPLAEALDIATALQNELLAHVPALAVANVRFGAASGPSLHHHAPEPVRVDGRLAQGWLEIVDTADGERMRLTLSTQADGLRASIVIARPGGKSEILPLAQGDARIHTSAIAPAEPHAFDATLHLAAGEQSEALAFHMAEPQGHPH